MAKRVKFPLDMGKDNDGNDILVREISELKKHYNAEKVTEYFLNGKLLTWLKDRYYDEEAEMVEELSKMSDKEKAAKKLPEIFGIEIKEAVDIEELEIRREKLEKLRAITSDDEILDNVDSVAFSQEDLGKLLNKNTKIIYLCGKSFSIPLSVKNVKYIGINKPIVTILCKDESIINIENNGLVFDNCDFSEITKARIEYYKKINENITYDDKKNMYQTNTTVKIPGKLKKRFYAIFDGNKIQITYVNIDANLVISNTGLKKILDGGVVAVPQITYIYNNESITMNCGDVVILIGKKASSFIGGFSDEELEIISMYTAAEKYYEYNMKCKDMQCTEFDIEQRAIKWLTYNGRINNDEQLMTLMALKKRNVNGATV